MHCKISPRHAFSLIELLTAVTIVVILVVMLSGLMIASLDSIRGDQTRHGALAGSRTAMDRIQSDLSFLLHQDGLGLQITKSAGNDTLAFFSQVPGRPGGWRKLSIVSYEVGATNLALRRTATAVNSLADIFPQSLTNPPATPAATNVVDPQDLATTVFRSEYWLQLTNGRCVGSFEDIPGPAAERWETVHSVLVGLAAVDEKDRLILSDAQLAGLPTLLRDVNPTNSSSPDLLAQWEQDVQDALSGGSSSIPKRVLQNIRFEQRQINVR